MDISHFIKVTCNGRKVAVHCDGNTYDEFLKNVSEKFNIPENNIEITTSDNTEVDNVYFNAIVKSVDQLNARDRTACESKASTEFSLQSPLQSPTSSISSRSCTSPLETGTQATIQIPWNKIPSSLNQAFEEEELITRKQRCLLIKILWDEIKQTNQRISRKILREVAAKVVRRHPRCFEKRMDGTILTDGIEELMLALEAKKDNENRPESCEKSKKPRLDIEVINSESFNQNELKDLFLKDKLTDVEKQKVRETMISTYQAQRIDFIDKDTTICMVKASWPFIFQSDYFFKHFEMLTSVNLLKLFNGIGEIQSVRIYNYLVAQKTCNLSEIQNLQEQPNITWTYQMLTQVFKEDLKELIVCQDSLKTDKLPCTPCIVGIGPSIFHTSKYVLVVDKEPVTTDITSLSVAMAMQFAAFYIFNICFPKKVINTMDAFQRFILKFKNENTPKKLKKKTCVNDQVLKFASDVARYEAFLECGEVSD